MTTRDPRGHAADVLDEEIDGVVAVQSLLDEFAEALTAGDGATIASLFAVPAMVISDGEARAVGSLDEVSAFFGGARERYNARGIADTRAEILDLTWPTDRIALVEVRWPYLDDRGMEKGEEISTYLVRRDEFGVFKVQAVIMQGVNPNS